MCCSTNRPGCCRYILAIEGRFRRLEAVEPLVADMKCPILVSLTAVLCLSIAHPAVAQVGRVNGLVKSEDGQALKGVTITAENSDIGQSLTATSDDKGRFVIIGLRSGVWSFTAQAPGFSAQM